MIIVGENDPSFPYKAIQSPDGLIEAHANRQITFYYDNSQVIACGDQRSELIDYLNENYNVLLPFEVWELKPSDYTPEPINYSEYEQNRWLDKI